MLVRPTNDYDLKENGSLEMGKVILGMESDAEPEELDEEKEPEEAVAAIRKPVEPLPSEEEQRRHRVTHLPYRSWCPQCVAAAANDDPHRSKRLASQGPLDVQEVHWDYCFPREDGDWVVVLVGGDRETRITIAHLVPYKGASVEWLSEQLVRDLHRLGAHARVVLKSDQEPAIVDVLKEVAKMRGSGRTVLEQSPVYDSKGNGLIERAVQSFEKILRTHKLALEDKLKSKLPVKHPVFAWLVEHCADLYNKYQVGRDGKTAMQRLKGKKCLQPSVEFCSPIMFRVVGKVQGGDMKERWHSGIFLGKKAGTEENLVMTLDGAVVRARAVREVHRVLRLEDLDILKGTPHDPAGTLRAGHRDEGRARELEEEEHEDVTLGPIPKRVQITRAVVNRFGASPGCMKCRGVVAGDKSYQFVHHSDNCRNRMESLMRQDNKFSKFIEAAEERQTRRISEILERRDQEAALRDVQVASREQQAKDEGKHRDGKHQTEEVKVEQEKGVPIGGGASSSSHVDQPKLGIKRKAEEQGGPEMSSHDADDYGDQDMGIPPATETTVANSRKRDAEPDGEPAAARPRLENIDALGLSEYEFDVSEVFSPPRVTKLAGEVGLKGGYSLDKEYEDPVTRKKWDFTRPKDQGQLWGLLKRRPSRLLISSPPCTTFSSLQRLRKTSMPEEVKAEGLQLLRIGVKACVLQVKSGGQFIFEHPAGASSWKEQCLIDLSLMEGVQSLTFDQCMYGLQSSDREGTAPARKATRILTNICGAERFLSTRCDHSHRHVELVHNRAKAAQIYPRSLGLAFLESLKFHMELKEAYVMELARIDSDQYDDDHDLGFLGHLPVANMHEQEALYGVMGLEAAAPPKDELHFDHGPWPDYHYFDENTGEKLDPVEVKKGDARELEKLRSQQVYDHVPRSEAKEGKLIRTRWVRVNKGSEVRCRFVAQEFASGDPRDDLFASTPPLFSARLVVSLAATKRSKLWNLMCLDISCAFLYAEAERKLYIEIPEGDPRAGDPSVVGRLREALYGTRDAPQLWQKTLAKVLNKVGFRSSKLQPGFFVHGCRELVLVTHVDDFLIAGPDTDLIWLRKELKKHFEINGVMIGEQDTKGEATDQVKFLGRTIRRTPTGFTWEADCKHAKILLEENGLETCKPLGLPMGRDESESTPTDRTEKPPMESKEATLFRRSAARLNYLSLDRPDIAVAVNRLARCMANPKVGDEVALKRVLRYLHGQPVCKLTFNFQDKTTKITALSDSDWAGCKITRKSTTGLAIFLGEHLLHFGSKMQKAIALSSGEAELVAQTAAVGEALAVSNLMNEFDMTSSILSMCDSSAARGILSRSGVGRIKHLELKHLWVQDLVQCGRVSIKWIPRSTNPADGLTHVSSEFLKHMESLNLQFCRPQPDRAKYALSEGGCWRFQYPCPALTSFLTPFGCSNSSL